MAHNSAERVLHIPLDVFESAESKDDLEEWLLGHDPVFIEEMRRLKSQADAGQGRSITD